MKPKSLIEIHSDWLKLWEKSEPISQCDELWQDIKEGLAWGFIALVIVLLMWAI